MLEKSPKIALKKVSYYALNFIILAVFYFIGTIPNTAHSTPFNFSTLFLKTHFPSSICLNSNSKPPKAPSYRGLSLGRDQSIWVSGSHGTVLKLKKTESINSVASRGKSEKSDIDSNPYIQLTEMRCLWDTVSPKGFSTRDFRDIECRDTKTAIVMSVGDSARILMTEDGGKSWNTVYRNDSKNVFLDAIAMDWNQGIGVAIGDPQSYDELLNGDSFNPSKGIANKSQIMSVSNSSPNSTFNLSPEFSGRTSTLEQPKTKYYLFLITLDHGHTWQRLDTCSALLPPDSIAAFFAGSGTSVHIYQSGIKTNKDNRLGSFYIQVGMAGGGINPVYRQLEINGKIGTLHSGNVQPNTAINTHSKENFQPKPTRIKSEKSSAIRATSTQYPVTSLAQVSHVDLPLSMGNGAGWGAYGGMVTSNCIVWVGGNYLFANHGDSTVNIFTNPKRPTFWTHSSFVATMKPKIQHTTGYKSGICSCKLKKSEIWFAAGSSGLDASINNGENWISLNSILSTTADNPSFNAITCHKNGIVIVGNRGATKYYNLLKFNPY